MNPLILKTLKKLITYWGDINTFPKIHRKMVSPYTAQELHNKLFLPGPSITYIFNYVTSELELVSDSVKEILGEDPDKLTFFDLFAMQPLSEMAKTLKDQKASFKLFRQVYDEDTIFDYKLVFTSRFKTKDGVIKTMLHQGMNMEVNDFGQITKVYVVHTEMSDVSFYDKDSMSLIGYNGLPSYYSLNNWKDVEQLPNVNYSLTNNQINLVNLIAKGKTNKDISEIQGTSIETIKSTRKKLLKKTNKANMFELISDCFAKGHIR